MEQSIYTPSPVQRTAVATEDVSHLETITKWGRITAIAGFVVVGLFVLVALTAGSWADSLSYHNRVSNSYQAIYASFSGFSVFISISYLIMAVIYFFPAFFLYRFSGQIRKALVQNDEEFLASAPGSLKSYFIFIGILLVIALMLLLGGIGMIGLETVSV